MAYVGGTFVLSPDGDFNRVIHVVPRDLGDLLWHRGGKEQHATFIRYVRQYLVDILRKPMLSISSASSRTTVRTFSRETVPRFIKSMSLPGVATMICTPRVSDLIWLSILIHRTPAKFLSLPRKPRSLRSPAIWEHNSG